VNLQQMNHHLPSTIQPVLDVAEEAGKLSVLIVALVAQEAVMIMGYIWHAQVTQRGHGN